MKPRKATGTNTPPKTRAEISKTHRVPSRLPAGGLVWHDLSVPTAKQANDDDWRAAREMSRRENLRLNQVAKWRAAGASEAVVMIEKAKRPEKGKEGAITEGAVMQLRAASLLRGYHEIRSASSTESIDTDTSPDSSATPSDLRKGEDEARLTKQSSNPLQKG